MAYSAKGDEIISEKRVFHCWECVWRHTVSWTREPGSGCEFGDGPPRLRRLDVSIDVTFVLLDHLIAAVRSQR